MENRTKGRDGPTEGAAVGWTNHGNGIRSKIRGRDGKRVFHCEVWCKGRRYTEKGGTTEKQAIKLLGQRQAQVDAGTYVPPLVRKRRERQAVRERLTVGKLCDRFLEEHVRARKLRSERWHGDVLGAVKAHALGGVYLDELTRPAVEAFLAERRKSGRKVNAVLAIVRRVFRFAVEHELLVVNPATRIRPDREHEREGVCLDTETRKALLDAAAPDFRSVLQFLLLTGCRIGEAAALEWGDVDLEAKRVRIARTSGSTTTKTGQGRTVPLVDDAVKVLRDLPSRFQSGRVFLVSGAPLVTYEGKKAREVRRYLVPWEKAVRAAVKATQAKAAEARGAAREALERIVATLEGARIHDTRHTFASDYVMRGGAVPALCSICGWSDWKMVQSRYGHLRPDYLDTEMARMAGAAGEIRS